MSSCISNFMDILQHHNMDPSICTILDIGCGNGKFTLELGKIFKTVLTIDSSPNAVSKLKHKIAADGLINITG